MRKPWTLFAAAALAATAVLAVAACGGDDDDDDDVSPAATTATSAATAAGSTQPTTAPASPTTAKTPDPVTLRLGYFPNVTHAQALVMTSDGSLQKELGETVKLDLKVFNAGPAVIEAMFAGEVDASFIGPNPAINGFQRSNGEALRIVSGAASAGALFVVRPEANIASAKDLANKKLATPQLGGTQDVALRAFIQDAGLKTKDKGGNVTILPTANADTLTLFQKGEIDGAWVPEPWGTRLILEAGGKLFLDERTLWPNGDFVTTHLIVRTEFLKKNPEAVRRLILATVKTTEAVNKNPEAAKATVNKEIERLTGKPLPQATIDASWKNLRFTYDPIASSLAKAAKDAFDAGLLGSKAPDLKGIYDLTLLNAVLAELKLTGVKE